MSRVRLLGEVALVLALSLLGLIAGAATGWPPLSPILGMVFPLAAATVFLWREGVGWRDLGFARTMPLGRFLGYTVGTLIVVFVVTNYLVTPVMRAFGIPPIDVAVLAREIEGNWATYLVFLLPIGWGSAAFGEELLARGYLLHRFAQLAGRPLAVVLQAAVFAAAHFYQGIMGVANIFALALIFGVVYYRCGRNLWPLIVAHGLTDTVGLTLLFLGRADLLTGADSAV